MEYCNNKKNNFKNYDDDNNDYYNFSFDKNQTSFVIFYIFHVIMALIAIYLSWKCNKGFDLLSFLIAIIFPYIYLIYIFATRGTCGVLPRED